MKAAPEALAPGIDPRAMNHPADDVGLESATDKVLKDIRKANTRGALLVLVPRIKTLPADDVALDATATLNSAGTISLVPQTASRPINLGTETAGSLSLTDAELDRVTAGTIRQNGAKSRLQGFEASYQQNLTFLPKPFWVTSLVVNMTWA